MNLKEYLHLAAWKTSPECQRWMESLETSCPIGEESRFLKNLAPLLESLGDDKYQKGYDTRYDDGKEDRAKRDEANQG
jgi:hypothetical protein